MADLPGKYQKLAGEYAKLKAQIPVLKKAYLDEQGEVNQLKELLKERDQTVRKYEQEVDSLTFRNQQLSKRVIVLQEEASETNGSKKKSKNKGEPTTPERSGAHNGAINVFNEELHNKIEENALLHKQLQELSAQFDAHVRDLQDQLKEAENFKGHHEEVLGSAQRRSKEVIDRLQEEKAMLEVKIQALETDLKDFRGRSDAAEQKLVTVEKCLQSRLQEARKIIEEKLPFIDTKLRDINGLNVPTHDRRHQLRAKELITQGANLVGELTMGLSNFFTYSEQRSKIYPADGVTEPLSPLNTKFCKHLHENMLYLRPVEQSLRSFLNNLKDDSLTVLETSSELQPFSENFKKMVAYINKLLPYYITSLEEENAVSSCTATLMSKNRDLLHSLKRLVLAFNKIDTYVALLAAQSIQGQGHPQSSHPKFFSGLCKSLNDLHEAVKEVSKHYNSKVSLEHQLPTATKELKRTDECVVASLISLVTNTGKMAAFMSGNLDFFCQPAGYRTRGSSINSDLGTEGPRSHPVVNSFRQRTSHFLSSIAKPIPDTVPYCVALQNRKTLYSSAESKEGLAKQLSVFQQKLTKLEQEKEHYLLELQLLKIKFENEQLKTKQLEKEVESVRGSSSGVSLAASSLEDHIEKLTLPSEASVRSDSVNSGSYLDTSMLGQLETSGTVKNDIDTREQLIINHYNVRINELTLQLQQAESKAVHFHAEVRALHKQLKIAEKAKENGQEELKIVNQSLAHLKDELQTTTRSYEGQLSMMSEHLAGMNEKLAQQKDEIDDLKQQLSQKGSSSKILKKTKK
ncbi:protein phosphatase 1 regulatory subunit 21-like [Biomphalaria glabrata]|uniref:Protein phosphatase 1 regulatory subunit 21 n=1 Tax=Biomphalaria glabrata TaxID=6526 RepID=A0A9W2ZZ76_BIOGL|nr:protein phosphatase 1 regulatory subunit 21-like [Biomphalaria glabrata]KAI8747518.1 protein phosphatase 1 regulatory subunit 21-like [Biomphalaria glabrata]